MYESSKTLSCAAIEDTSISQPIIVLYYVDEYIVLGLLCSYCKDKTAIFMRMTENICSNICVYIVGFKSNASSIVATIALHNRKKL